MAGIRCPASGSGVYNFRRIRNLGLSAAFRAIDHSGTNVFTGAAHSNFVNAAKTPMADMSKMTWYVSYIAGGSLFDQRPPRATKTFGSEGEAKEFARIRAAAGDQTLIAGTINPASPKRVIPSASIAAWLDGAG
jgi:hypothetical protein